MDTKITARLSLFILLITLAPFFILSYQAFGLIRSSLEEPVREINGSYVVCTVTGCSSYDKSMIDEQSAGGERTFLDEYQDIGRNSFYLNVSNAEVNKQSQKSLGLLFATISGVYLLLTAFLWFKNKIFYEDNYIEISSFLNSIGRVRAKFKTSAKKTVPVEKIEKIHVVTTTPFAPTKNSLEQLNWRDRIEIVFEKESGSKDFAIVELYVFPRFKKIIKAIVGKRPEIEIAFLKVSVMQNLEDFN